MTTPSLVRAELGRLTATPLARLAFIALMVVPLLYGGAYLWANRDPYAGLDRVPAAIVDQDAGATQDGKHVDYGHDVERSAVDGGDFDWHVTDAADARSGVRNGTYDFVVTIPHDFSRSLVSSSGGHPQRASLVMTTADTNSYLASTIAEQAGKTMRTAVAERVGKQAASTLLVGLADVRDSLGDAVDGAGQLASGASTAADGASSLAEGTGKLATGAASLAEGTKDLPAQTTALDSGAQQVSTGASTLSTGLTTLQQGTTDLPTQTAALNEGAQEVAAGNKSLADATDPALDFIDGISSQKVVDAVTAEAADRGVTLTPEVQAVLQDAVAQQLDDPDVHADLATAKQQLAGIDDLRDGSAQVAAGTAQLAAQTPQLTSGIASAATGASTLSSGASQVATGTAALAKAAPTLSSGAAALSTGATAADDGATKLSTGTAQVRDGATELADRLDEGRTKIPASTAGQRDDQASVISDPVHVRTDDVAAAGNYGAGLAPFFISLAAWIGMYALFLILKPISKRALTAVRKPVAITLGAWLTPALLGLVQMVALFGIVRYVLGFDVVHSAATIGVMVLASATFAAIIMALNVMLGSVGQFLGLVLMLVQLVTAGGTFPWQTLPGPLAALHHALPMTYSVDAIRQTMYGGSMAAVGSDALVLLSWLLGALLVTGLIAARQGRSRTLRDLRPSLIG